jgi:RND family efflux transporter MFP subunit
MTKKIIITSIIALLAIGGIAAKLIHNKEKAEEVLSKNSLNTNLEKPQVEQASDEKVIQANEFSYLGKTEANREIQVNATAQGVVKTDNIKLNGRVAQGTTLIEIDTDLLKNSIELAEITLEKNRRDLSRLEALKSENNISIVEVENARMQVKSTESQLFTLKKQIQEASIKAPIGGQIVEKNIEKGIYLNMGSVVATITDVSTIKLVIQVPENELRLFPTNKSVAVQFDAYPDKKFQGKVALIRLKGGEAGRFPVEIVVSNSSTAPLRVGMVGVVNL